MDRKDQNVVADWLKTPQSGQTYMTTPPSSARNWVRNKAVDAGRGLGFSKYGAQDLGDLLAGDYTNGMGVGVADFLPGLGTYMGAEEGVDAYQRGDAIGTTAGALGTAASLLPVVGPLMSKGIRAGALDAGTAFLKDQFGGLPIPGSKKPGQFTSEDVRSGGELFYSPSQLAALNMKQSSGDLARMRAELIKAGAKEEELRWTDFDRAFADQTGKVRNMDFYRHFRNAPAPYRVDATEATGITGNAGLEDHEIRDRFIDDSLDSETAHYRDTVLPERLRDEMKQVRDLDEEELAKYARENGYGDDVESFLESEGEKWFDPTYSLDYSIYDEEDAVRALLEDPESAARSSLEDQFDYEDIDDLRSQYSGGDTFDAGDTEYGKYFPPGGRNYRENMAFMDPDFYEAATGFSLGEVERNTPSHFSSVSDDPNLFWTRSADFPVAGTEGKTARYVGEVQSDWAQQGQAATDGQPNPRRTRSLAEEISMPGLRENVRSAAYRLTDAKNYATNTAPFGFDTDYELGPVGGIPDPGRWGSNSIPPKYRGHLGADLPPEDALRYSFDTRAPSAGHFAGNFVRDRVARVPQAWLDEQGVESALDIPTTTRSVYGSGPDAWTPQGLENAPPYARGDSLSTAWVRQNQPLPEDGLPGLETPERYRGNGDWLRNYGTAQEDYQAAYDAQDAMQDRYTAGPYVRETSDWARQALRNELADAVSSYRPPDFLTLNSGDDDLVRAVSGGNLNPKPFYERGPVNPTFGKLAKEYGGKIEDVPIRLGDDTSRFVPGIRLTPEFIAEVKRKGIPYFIVPGGMMLGAAGANEGQEEGF